MNGRQSAFCLFIYQFQDEKIDFIMIFYLFSVILSHNQANGLSQTVGKTVVWIFRIYTD